MILDCVNPDRKVLSIQKSKKYELLKYLRMYKQLKQLKIERQDVQYDGYSVIRIVVHGYLGELKLFPRDLIRKRIWEMLTFVPQQFVCDENKQIYAFQTLDGMEEYVPDNLPWTGESDELYLDLLQKIIAGLCEADKIHKVEDKLIFVDDGSRDVDCFLKVLCRDWNYVAVYSKRHEQLENAYACIYEKEGLIVECLDKMPQEQQGGVVIDLTGSWNGLHRVYPENSLVLDLTYSREKERYLRAKNVRLADYIPVASARAENLLNSSSVK